MAFSRLFCCDTCATGEALLTFAEEWAAGSPPAVPLPYPGWGKVRGLVSRLWCPGCRAVRPHVLLELDPPADHAVVAYAEAQRQGLTGRETGPCSVCQTLLQATADNASCPACDQGTLRFTGEWEDAV